MKPSTQGAGPAEAAVPADVPGLRALGGASEPVTPSVPSMPSPPSARAQRTRVAALPGQAPDTVPPGGGTSGVGVRRRLARLGAQRGTGTNPVLEPLIKTVRATHPKADIRLIERAYESAAYWHRDQKRRSGDPYITH